jgi:hypothetical protein
LNDWKHHDSYYPANKVTLVKSRRIGRTGDRVHMERSEMRTGFLWGKPETKGPLVALRCRKEGNISMNK